MADLKLSATVVLVKVLQYLSGLEHGQILLLAGVVRPVCVGGDTCELAGSKATDFGLAWLGSFKIISDEGASTGSCQKWA